MATFDVAIEALLQQWGPRIGLPTCGPGCSNCCERTTIFLSSAEALRIVDYQQPYRAQAALLQTLDLSSAAAARNSLIDLGPCAFLDGSKRCSVYEVRPDACRACHVWHPADYCGRDDYDMCTPAELNALRVDRIHELMLAEWAAGRRPFWGQLLPMTSVLGEHRERYLGGEDLRSQIDSAWLTTALIEFPSHADLESERTRLAHEFAAEENPMGHPRAADAPDRRYLDAFPLD
jgi:Fe-S-cluster containining protein